MSPKELRIVIWKKKGALVFWKFRTASERSSFFSNFLKRKYSNSAFSGLSQKSKDVIGGQDKKTFLKILF